MVCIDWSIYSLDTKMIDLECNQITEMNWYRCYASPSGLQVISLLDNLITEMNWEGAPSSLKDIYLQGNRITKMNWEGAPGDVEILPRKLNDLKDEYIKSIKYIKSKSKHLRPITDQIKHLSLTNPENSKCNVVRKYCGAEFRELMEEALGFDLVH